MTGTNGCRYSVDGDEQQQPIAGRGNNNRDERDTTMLTTTSTNDNEQRAPAGQPVSPPPLNTTINKHWGQTDGKDGNKRR